MSVPAAGAKRRLPPKVAKMRERKKQKLQQNDHEQKHYTLSAGEQSNATAGTIDQGPVKLDDLSWNEVELPDQMEDYAGFYGLEEIDGVDVVRDEKSGQVSYEMAHSSKLPKNSASQAETSEDSTRKQDPPQSTQDPDDEWSGIEDDTEENRAQLGSSLPDPAVENTNKKDSSSNAAKAKDPNPKKTEQKKNKPASTETQLNKTGFGLLQDEDDSGDADVSAWSSLNLSQEILSSLSKLGFSRPTEIQSSSIPHIRAGHDLIGKAPTGSGKTLAFGIPIVEEWQARVRQLAGRKNTLWMRPSALVLVPTRELAHQITAHLQALLSQIDDLGGEGGARITIATITGGLSIQKQNRLIAQAQIVVGTPGRLWEVIREGQGLLAAMRRIKFLVLDEADRLLSEGHFKELEEILNALDKEVTAETDATPLHVNPPPISHKRQTLVFSATFSKDLQQKLSRRGGAPSLPTANKQDAMAYLLRRLNFQSSSSAADDDSGTSKSKSKPKPKPHFVDVNPVEQMAANLREGLVECPVPADKDLYLYTLLLYHHPGARALVFVNSVAAVRRLAPFLTNLGLPAFGLHSHMPQKARLRSVERFSSTTSTTSSHTQPTNNAKNTKTPKASKQKDSKILIATDIAARGLDIPNITLVLHYNVPRTADAYIHRSGRTARAAAYGSSILLCAPGEAAGVRRLVAQVHARSSSSSSSGAALSGRGKGGTKGMMSTQSPELHHLTPSARLVSALRRRVGLAKRLADSVLVGQKKRREEDFFRAARAELRGSSDEGDGDGSASESGFGGTRQTLEEDDDDDVVDGEQREPKSADGGKGRGRGKVQGEERSIDNSRRGQGQRQIKGKNSKEQLTQSEAAALRGDLKAELGRKVNVGVSERYLVGRGGETVERLLRERQVDGGDEAGGNASVTGGFAGGMVLGTVEGLGW